MRSLPKIAISVGDVAGVGPELALQCISQHEVKEACQPILYGPATTICLIADRLQLNPPSKMVDIGDPGNAIGGTFTAETGMASFQAFDAAVTDAIEGKVAAVVTGPIHKEAWHQAGIQFPGHTEVLANRTGTQNYSMMLTSDEISCVLATIHIPLADVPSRLSTESIFRAIGHGSDALSRRLGRPARIVVCGLNPHAGENGLFSHGEEDQLIKPAIKRAVELGMNITGPVPPDTAFTPAMRQQTDVYVCMYHDQGLIPLKALSFDDGVNVTLGLPIVRTSVDHGTALPLAWKGTASCKSMLSAIKMAVELQTVPVS